MLRSKLAFTPIIFFSRSRPVYALTPQFVFFCFFISIFTSFFCLLGLRYRWDNTQMRQGQCCCCCTSRLVTTTTTMPALRCRYVCLLSTLLTCTFTTASTLACPVSIHVYSLFYLVVVLLMALMRVATVRRVGRHLYVLLCYHMMIPPLIH
ncbi:hypothetical protein BJY52DRAFT_1264767, partial [Lactarius psammicola]